MWALIIKGLKAFFGPFLSIWAARLDAKKDAETEMAAEIAHADRAKANQIRDTVDAARVGGGLRSTKPDDQRGYRD